MKRPITLTIAGSDSGGGAGIQQDLKVFTVLGTFGASVVTALTAQNTLGVHGIEAVNPAFVKKQLEVVLEDLRPTAIKTGMLANAEIVRAVAETLAKYRGLYILIIDPVMVSKSGHRLVDDKGVAAMKDLLFPLAAIITPNIPEAEVLTGLSIGSPKEMRGALEALGKLAPGTSFVLKGGHLAGTDSVDLVLGPDGIVELHGERLSNKHTHGTGCTFSAALTAFVAKGQTLERAVRNSKEFVTQAIKAAWPVGSGIGPMDPFSWTEREMARYQVIQVLEDAWNVLSSRKSRSLVPEVQLNLGYALPLASAIQDVAAFPGRIVGLGEGVARVAGPAFGASSHVARIILTAMSADPAFRSAMNIRYDSVYVQRAREVGLEVCEFSRAKEPEEVKEREGSTLVWGVQHVIEELGRVPDVIFDLGDMGKEPMIRVLGKNPLDVVEKAFKISGLA